MTDELSAFSRGIFAAAVCASALGFAGPAAAGPESLRQGLFGPRPSEGRQYAAPPIARYVSEDGDVFVLDRSQPRPLLKFENSVEVWVLQPLPAPRGDVIYKNDLGEPMLRATRLGGVTVFTDQRPEGSAAALAGSGNPLRLMPLTPQALVERLLQASVRASRAARHGVLFDAEATPGSSAVIADAALVTSLAVVRLSEKQEGRSVLARLRRVLLMEGRKSSARFEQGTMLITVAPTLGLAGRPSSDRIIAVARASKN
jgi:hypothetical protein